MIRCRVNVLLVLGAWCFSSVGKSNIQSNGTGYCFTHRYLRAGNPNFSSVALCWQETCLCAARVLWMKWFVFLNTASHRLFTVWHPDKRSPSGICSFYPPLLGFFRLPLLLSCSSLQDPPCPPPPPPPVLASFLYLSLSSLICSFSL